MGVTKMSNTYYELANSKGIVSLTAFVGKTPSVQLTVQCEDDTPGLQRGLAYVSLNQEEAITLAMAILERYTHISATDNSTVSKFQRD